MDYVVIVYSDKLLFENKVSHYLKLGYKLCGSVSTCVYFNDIILTQAMLKE